MGLGRGATGVCDTEGWKSDAFGALGVVLSPLSSEENDCDNGLGFLGGEGWLKPNCGSFDPKDDELVTDTSGVLVSVAGEGVA